MRAVIDPIVAASFGEDRGAIDVRYTAILFRGKVYVSAPRHMDAINLAFAGMSQHQKWVIGNRISDGKEKMLFGSANGDGSGWEWDEKSQKARMTMYGFD